MSKFGIAFAMPSVAPPEENQVDNLTRPIMGIENRTPLEVWQIMCDRIANASTIETPPLAAQDGEPSGWIVERPLARGGTHLYLPFLHTREEADRYRKNNPDEVLVELYRRTTPPSKALNAGDGEAVAYDGHELGDILAMFPSAGRGPINKGEYNRALRALAYMYHHKPLTHPAAGRVSVSDAAVTAALDAKVGTHATVRDYLWFNAADAREFGVLGEGEEFAGLDIIRNDQMRGCAEHVMRAALTASLSSLGGGE